MSSAALKFYKVKIVKVNIKTHTVFYSQVDISTSFYVYVILHIIEFFVFILFQIVYIWYKQKKEV